MTLAIKSRAVDRTFGASPFGQLSFVVALVLCLGLAPTATAQPLRVFQIRFVTLASPTADAAATASWLAEQVRDANTIFAPSGIAFNGRARDEVLPAQLSQVLSRQDRDTLATLNQPEVINVYVVERLRDVDDPSIDRMGVHWRHRTDRQRLGRTGRHCIVLSRRAVATVLAHELGHFFGNPHSSTPNNIMSYQRDGTVPPFFDPGQLRRIRSFAARYIRTRELVLSDESLSVS